MTGLIELPQKFPNRFEEARTKAELDYGRNIKRERDLLHLLALMLRVFFAFCAVARAACKERQWLW